MSDDHTPEDGIDLITRLRNEIRQLRDVLEFRTNEANALKDRLSMIDRPVLLEFAFGMEDKLRKNSHKTGWRDLPVEALFRQMLLEIEEFKVALEFLPVEEGRKELIDCANFCLIMWDRLSLLDQTKPYGAQK